MRGMGRRGCKGQVGSGGPSVTAGLPPQVKLVNIRNDDIADGNPKLTLGLIWTIILHFQVRWAGGPPLPVLPARLGGALLGKAFPPHSLACGPDSCRSGWHAEGISPNFLSRGGPVAAQAEFRWVKGARGLLCPSPWRLGREGQPGKPWQAGPGGILGVAGGRVGMWAAAGREQDAAAWG